MSLISDNPLTHFSKGFFAPFRSIRFLNQHAGLYRFIIIPFFINLFTFVGVIYYGLDFFRTRVMGLLPSEDAWYWALLQMIVLFLGVLATLVLVFFTFTVIGNLIASPFNDILSEKTEERIVGRKSEEPFQMRIIIRDAVYTVGVEIKKLGVYLGGMLFIFALFFIPMLGAMLYSVLSVVWTIYFLVVEYTGYIYSRKRRDFREQRLMIRSNFFLMAGFGTGVFCLLAIPFIQLLCIPLAVIGATRLLIENDLLDEKGVSESGSI